MKHCSCSREKQPEKGNEQMQNEDRIKMIFTATPEALAAVDAALNGKTPEAARPPSLRLYRMGEAADITGLSRVTIWRAIKEGNLKAVDIRKQQAHS